MEIPRVRRPNSIFIPTSSTPSHWFNNASLVKQLQDLDDSSDSDDDNGDSLLSCRLNSRANEIVGPQAAWNIVKNVSSRTALPEGTFKEVPMHLSMTGINVATGGLISVCTKQKLMDRILEMNGTVTANINMHCTHMIATFGVSDKVSQARQLGISVMKVGWVKAVWDASQTDPYVHAIDDRFQEFQCPLFHNVHFKISSMIPEDTLHSLKPSILNNGGKLSTTLRTKISIYITNTCEDPLYLPAKNACIPVVSPSWIFACAISKKLENIKFYEIHCTSHTQL